MKKYFFALLLTSCCLFSFAILPTTYTVSPTDSTITWKGSKLGGTHTGLILIKEGFLTIQNEKIIGGKVDIDMSSIFCTDIEDRETAQKLEGHLKSADFFDIENFPFATLEVLSMNPNEQKDTYEVKANLTIKDITKEIIFPAKIQVNNQQIIADRELTIDRTEYDVTYMAESLTGQIKYKFIYNNFDLNIHLIANRK